jgi:hypothetical protein
MMKKAKISKTINRKLFIATLCIGILTAAAVVTAMQISVDSPASLPSDI